MNTLAELGATDRSGGKRPLSLQQATMFVAVARAGSLSGGAKALGMTQPALSRSIQSLEAALGAELFERLPAGVRLTGVGERFLKRAQELISLNAEVSTAMAAWKRGTQASLSVAGDASVLQTIGSALLSNLAQEFDGCRLSILDASSHEVLAQVAGGERSVGITLEADERANLHYSRVLRADLGLLVAAHSEVPPSLQSPDDLHGMSLVRLDDAAPLTKLLRRMGRPFQAYFDSSVAVSSVALGEQLVHDGRFAMVASGIDALRAAKLGLRFIAVPCLPKLFVYLVTRRDAVFDARRELLRDVIRQTLLNNPWHASVAGLGGGRLSSAQGGAGGSGAVLTAS